MTDRELLELAAKAAGIPCDKKGPYVERQEWQQWFGEPGRIELVAVAWNPLTDDGDALRLAVKLHMALTFNKDGNCHAEGLNEEYAVECMADSCAATRRAIVRAAAEIGKSMK
jgi:hypothetical protein